MPYTAGSQGAQASSASVFMTTLDPLLVAAGYTFVEQVINAAQTVRVYKSPAESNFFGQDWYLIVRRDTDTDIAVYFSVTEQYNSTTHLCFNYAPSAASLTPTASFAVNDATGKAPGNNALGFRYVSTPTAGFSYWLSLTPNRCAVAVRAAAVDTAVYAGLYDDLQPLAISPFPLGVCPLSHGNAASGYATREPNTITSAASNFRAGVAASGNNTWTVPMTSAELYSQRIWLSRVMTCSGRTGMSVRGLLRDVWTSGSGGVNGVNGDTLAAYIGGASKTLVQFRDGASSHSFFIDSAI